MLIKLPLLVFFFFFCAFFVWGLEFGVRDLGFYGTNGLLDYRYTVSGQLPAVNSGLSH